jgi:hypothetical protein
MVENGKDGDPAAQHAPSPVVYTAEEVAKRFKVLLEGLDFRQDMQEMGIGCLSLFKRRKARQQLTALTVALWRLALERSFPRDAEVFFGYFLDNDPLVRGTGPAAGALRALIDKYLELLAEKKDADFSEAARHMAEALKIRAADTRAFSLKAALRVRRLYTLIFDNLI